MKVIRGFLLFDASFDYYLIQPRPCFKELALAFALVIHPIEEGRSGRF